MWRELLDVADFGDQEILAFITVIATIQASAIAADVGATVWTEQGGTEIEPIANKSRPGRVAGRSQTILWQGNPDTSEALRFDAISVG